MLSLVLITALSAIGDTPNNAPTNMVRPGNHSGFSTFEPIDFSQSTSQSFYAPNAGFGGCGCYCPSDDANIFLPCAPLAPCPINCFPSAPRPVTMRVNVYGPPPQVRVCPPPPPRVKAPCP